MKLRNKKTGVVVDTKDYGFNVSIPSEPLYGYKAYDVIAEYNSLAELNDEWEDYEPKEPLIKDEKVRKAVRAWARENLIEKVDFKLDRSKSQCACYFYDESCKICEFGLKFYLDIEHDKVYTIEELCGEVEE